MKGMHLMTRSLLVATLGLMGSACGASDYPYDGPLGGEGGAARDCFGHSEFYEIDEETPLGFSGQDVLDAFADDMHATLTWGDGGTSTLTISITIDEGANGGLPSHFTPSETYDGCAERVDVPVRLSLSTDDGLLDAEVFQGYVGALDVDGGEFAADRSANAFAGNVDWASLADPGTYDPEVADVILALDLAPDGGTGALTLHTHDEGSGDFFNDVVASW